MAMQESINRIVVQADQEHIKQDPISKITNAKRADRVTQVIEHLPSPEFNAQYYKKKSCKYFGEVL
jgi:hypothetical protein